MKKKVIISSLIILVIGIICAVIIYVNRSSSAQEEEPQLPMFYDGTKTDAVPNSTSDILDTWTEVPVDTKEDIVIVAETDIKEEPYSSSKTVGTAKVDETYEVLSSLVENEYVRTSKGYISMLDAEWVSALSSDEEMS